MSKDLELLYFLNGLVGRSEFLDALIIFLAEYLGYFLIALFFLFLYFSTSSRRRRLYIFLSTGVAVLVSRLIITEVIRFLYYRPRPFLEHPEIVQLLPKESSGSFPSGHSALFFALAVMVLFYNKKWGSVLLAGAILMNIARVAAGVHYLSDILGGMVIGVLSVAACYSIFSRD